MCIRDRMLSGAYFHYSVQANHLKLGKSRSIDPYSTTVPAVQPLGNIVPIGGPTSGLPTTAVPARHSIRSIDSGLGEDPNHSDRETSSEVSAHEHDGGM